MFVTRHSATSVVCIGKWSRKTLSKVNDTWISGKHGCQVGHFQQKRFKMFRPSYAHNPGDVALIANTIGQQLEYTVERHGDREAVVDCHQGIRKNFTQYNKDINNLAKGLLSLNLKRGDRIGIWALNRYEWLVTQYATAKLGLILVTINPAYQPPELEYCIKKVDMRALVCQDKFKVQDYYKMVAAVIPEVATTKTASKIKSAKFPYFDTLIMMTDEELPGTFKFKDVCQAGGSAEEQTLDKLRLKIQCNDPANIQFTSGTTGQPKAVTVSHFNLINGNYVQGLKYNYDKEYLNICGIVPMFHAMGSMSVSLYAATFGLGVVLPSLGFDPGATLKSIEDYRCESISGTPTMYIDILRHPDFSKTDLSSLTRGVIGGAPVSPHLMKTIMDKMGIPGLVNGYGLTETCAGVFANLRDDPLPEKLHTCGRVFELMEAKIVDPEGNIVPLGTQGEIYVRGYKVMMKYWGDEQATREAFTEDGFLKTGDAGTLNEDGTLVITERIKDMIIRGGENIYPREIEDFLATHPKILEVQVVGVPDDRMGEEVSAWIILHKNETMTESEVKEFCKGKIAHFKIPRYIQFVPNLPKTLSGKVKKYILKQRLQEILAKK